MNQDDRNLEGQGYGQNNAQQGNQQPEASQQQQPMSQDQDDGGASTGQAAYGNSGETDTLGQNSSSQGQESDLGQSGSPTSENTMFGGPDSDMGNQQSPEASGGFGQNQQDPAQRPADGSQNFAEDGQGAMDGNPVTSESDDDEVERAQGRESGFESNNL